MRVSSPDARHRCMSLARSCRRRTIRRRCLVARPHCGRRRRPDELIVQREPAGAGPPRPETPARRAGLRLQLVFVDSDVEVHVDALTRIERSFEARIPAWPPCSAPMTTILPTRASPHAFATSSTTMSTSPRPARPRPSGPGSAPSVESVRGTRRIRLRAVSAAERRGRRARHEITRARRADRARPRGSRPPPEGLERADDGPHRLRPARRALDAAPADPSQPQAHASTSGRVTEPAPRGHRPCARRDREAATVGARLAPRRARPQSRLLRLLARRGGPRLLSPASACTSSTS